MAHFAQLDENNVVIQVIVLDNKDAITEKEGKDFISSIGLEGTWIQTSYNSTFRGKFAGIGSVYNLEDDVFATLETAATNYQSSWDGRTAPIAPSILFDAPARCANVWTTNVLNQAFPTAFQRWGYPNPHSIYSFSPATHAFDVIVSVLRPPVDAMASQVVMFNSGTKNNRALNLVIQAHIDMLQAMLDDKNNVTFFSFESVTQRPEEVTAILSGILGVPVQPFNKEALLTMFNPEATLSDGFYSLPIDNKDELEAVKVALQQERFADLMGKANDLYAQLLVFKEA